MPLALLAALVVGRGRPTAPTARPAAEHRPDPGGRPRPRRHRRGRGADAEPRPDGPRGDPRFARYYSAAPICSPSRCGLLTGQYPGAVADHQLPPDPRREQGVRAGRLPRSRPRRPCPGPSRRSGYATAHVGKWHLGGGRDVVDARRSSPPTATTSASGRGRAPSPTPDLTARDWIWSAVDPARRWDRSRLDGRQDPRISSAPTPTSPCFVNLWLDDPHTPWVPSAEDEQAEPRTAGRPARGDTPPRLSRGDDRARPPGRPAPGILPRQADRVPADASSCSCPTTGRSRRSPTRRRTGQAPGEQAEPL